MDPLSIIASIIAVLQATSSVISICYEIRAAKGQAPKSLVLILKEVRNVRDVLESIQVLLDDIAGSSNPFKSSQWFATLESTLSTTLAELQDLESKIVPLSFSASSSSNRKAILSILGWRLKEADTNKILQRLHSYKTTLSLALTVAESTILVDIRNTGSTIQKLTETAGSHIKLLYDKTMSLSQREIIEWLCPVSSSESHECAQAAHQAGTSGWLTACEEFEAWIKGAYPVLWLSGPPGAGKTILFSHVVDYLANVCSANQPDYVAAFVYCDFRKPEGQRSKDVLGSFLSQICSSTGEIPQGLFDAYEESRRGGQKRRPTLELLQDHMRTLPKQKLFYLLVDALDESADCVELAELLQDIAKSSVNVRVIATSRNDLKIQQALSEACRVRLEDHPDRIDQDIGTYIGSRLQSDRQLRWLSSDVQNHILNALSTRSGGMFRWVQCQLDNISNLRTVEAVNKALSALPEGLYETYDRILEVVSTYEADCLRRILQWVSFAVLPLRLEDLHEAISVVSEYMEVQDSDVPLALKDPIGILALGGSLICLTSGGYVRLAHLSVRDYLLSSYLQQNPKLCNFSLDSKETHEYLAIACLTFISSPCFGDGPRTSAESYLLRIKEHPLLRYAPMAWSYHVRAASTGKSSSSYRIIQDLVTHFFSSAATGQFMTWVQNINADFDFKWDIYPRHATPLYYAASFGLLDVVTTLVFDPNTSLDAPGSRFGGTALHAATLRQHVPVMRALLNAGADPNKADFNHVTPLHTAVTHANVEVVELLIKRGANQDVVDSMGLTPRTWAERAGQHQMVRMLENGVINSRDTPAGSSEPRSPEPLVWRRTLPYFPDFYSKRSGLDSSIVVKVEIGPTRLTAAREDED